MSSVTRHTEIQVGSPLWKHNLRKPVRLIVPTAKVAPDWCPGFTHVWAEGEQYCITDHQAHALVICDLIEYSPDDGPHARVYRPRDGIRLNTIKAVIGREDAGTIQVRGT